MSYPGRMTNTSDSGPVDPHEVTMGSWNPGGIWGALGVRQWGPLPAPEEEGDEAPEEEEGDEAPEEGGDDDDDDDDLTGWTKGPLPSSYHGWQAERDGRAVAREKARRAREKRRRDPRYGLTGGSIHVSRPGVKRRPVKGQALPLGTGSAGRPKRPSVLRVLARALWRALTR